MAACERERQTKIVRDAFSGLTHFAAPALCELSGAVTTGGLAAGAAGGCAGKGSNGVVAGGGVAPGAGPAGVPLVVALASGLRKPLSVRPRVIGGSGSAGANGWNGMI